MKVPLFEASHGAKVRVHINSRDVALALSPPAHTSVQNIFPAIVEQVSEHDGALVDVRLDIGSPISARVTRKARRDLDLKDGQRLFVMVKSVAISRGANGRHEW